MGALFLASVVAVVVLAVPGFFLYKALRLSNLMALAAAPLASCALYAVLPIVYDAAGIRCGIANMLVAPTAVLALLAWLSWRRAQATRAIWLHLPAPAGSWRDARRPAESGFDWAAFLLYLACGTAVCSICFIANLGSPDAFFSRYDNQTHLNLAQAFVDSGQWCCLHHSRYAASLANQTPYLTPGYGFYPTTWHALVALVVLISGVKVTVASNALVAAVASVVFPGGMFLLIRTLFPGNRSAVLFGALATVGFATYPWVFAIKGPTFPNMLGYAVMVPFIAIFIGFLEAGLVRRMLPAFALFCLISLASMAVAHTNSLFTAFVFLAAYGGHYLWRAVGESPRVPAGHIGRTRAAVIGVYLALIAAFWAFCLTTPLLQVVVGYSHIEANGFLFSLKGLVRLTFTINWMQYAMIVVVIVGIISCIRRRMWWILIPVAYMAFGYFITRASYQPWLTIFMGLWYSLPYRAAACLCIFLMPVSALAFADIAAACTGFLRRRPERFGRLARRPQWAVVALVALFCLVTYPPIEIQAGGHTIFQTPYNSIYKKLSAIYAQDGDRVYGAEEVAFVDRAHEIAGDALVLNQPNDGSLFSYGVNHLNVYYRASALKRQTPDSDVLRKHLDDYATDAEVQAAVRETDARYVLQLDQGVSYEDLIKLPQYYEKNRANWIGIDRIRDDTPGFTVVLAEGDMRLYRIDNLGSGAAVGGSADGAGASNGADAGNADATDPEGMALAADGAEG